MNYDPFVLPFTIGSIVLFAILLYYYLTWISRISYKERGKIWKGIFSKKLFISIKEVFQESLFHRKIFRVNPVLGYMHTSLAFGWFLLIIAGTVESKMNSTKAFNMPYEPIFFKFFQIDRTVSAFPNTFNFIMDFLLLIILTGVMLAVIKRFYSKLFGMKRTTKLKPGDKFALYSLWLIFPLRFFAESFTSGVYNNGGFLTGTAGTFFAGFLPVESLSYIAWWAYSSALGIFFISLPFSRYMHIPTEVVLIFIRNFGIKTKKNNDGFAEIEVHACPRCGICIDKCQLSMSAITNTIQPSYFLQSVRHNNTDENKTFNCLLCGRCMEYCPVGIDINAQRMIQREKMLLGKKVSFDYLEIIPETKKADVIYFAGCMTHLTPKIKLAMVSIFRKAKVDYMFMDEDGSICCGRPLMMNGNDQAAQELIRKNIQIIKASKAKLLVTSCPICFKIFTEEYKLDIEVMHHTQYILKLAEEKKINLKNNNKTVVFHDPCELGRGSGVYEQPRKILEMISTLQLVKDEKNASLCCGGSLGNTELDYYKRDEITKDALAELENGNPDVLVTACPLCKKTFNKFSRSEVMDIAELVDISMEK